MCSKIERENRLNIKPVGKGQNEGSYSKLELILRRPSMSRQCLAKKDELNHLFSPAKAGLFRVVLLLPRNQSHFLPVYVCSHVDHSGIRRGHKRFRLTRGAWLDISWLEITNEDFRLYIQLGI